MNQSFSLSEILTQLHELGYTEHFYLQDGQVFLDGSVMGIVQHWIHCHWHDELTDETIAICCCIVDGFKGVFLF
jgi:hypothetical protein